jgi:predicted nucleic acid-binding protein
VAVTIGLGDTTIFVATETGRTMKTSALPGVIRVSVITIGELRSGVLSASDGATRARRLETLTRALRLDPVPVDDAVAEAWANLRVTLVTHGRRMAINDSWIAATAMALRIPVVTQDADYVIVPGLDVIHV